MRDPSDDSQDRRAALAALAPEIERFLAHHGGDRALGKDLAQETLARAMAALGSLESTSALRSWVLRIAVNVFNDHLRRARCQVEEEFEAGDSEVVMDPLAEPPEAKALRDELDDALRRAVFELPERQRTVLLLHSLKSVSHAEIASSLGVSEQVVKVTLFRAREALRTKLSRAIEDIPRKRRINRRTKP